MTNASDGSDSGLDEILHANVPAGRALTFRVQSQRFHRITTQLVGAVDRHEVAEVVLRAVQDALGADVGSLSLVTPDGEAIETLAFVGALDPKETATYQRVPLRRPLAATDAIRTRKPVFIESEHDHEEKYPAAAREKLYKGGTRGAVPLAVGDRVLGSINFGFAAWRRVSEDERLFMNIAAEQCALALERSRLFEAEKLARAQAEVSRREANLLYTLTETVNKAETLEAIYAPALRCVSEGLRVDRASILLFDADGVMRFKADRGLSEEYRKAVDGHSPWPAEESNPQPILVPDVVNDARWAMYRELFAKEKIRSLGFIPLVHRNQLLGKFMVYGDQPKEFTSREVELAQAIGTQIAQAVARARLIAAERLARADAEQAADNIRRLQTITANLSEAATPAEVAEVVVAQGVAATGASTGGLWLRSTEHTLELVHAQGFSEEGRKNFARIDLRNSLGTPVTDVFRANEVVWIESQQEFTARYPELAAATMPRPEYRIACLPIRIRGQCIAALAFTFDFAAAFETPEREFLINIARQASLALERSQLLSMERRARAEAEAAHRRASFKAEASAILASSLDYETTLKNVAKLAVPKFADWCAVELVDAEGGSNLVAVEHVDPNKLELAWFLRERYPADPDAQQGVPQVLRTGIPELYKDISPEMLAAACRDAEHLSLAKALGLTSAINAPISVHGRTIGVITFIWAESAQRYDATDLETAVLLGQRAGLAIENSNLHRNLQRSVKTRDDLLAVVSHDLRNPLGVVSIKAEAILQTMTDGPTSAKTRKHIEGIQSAVARMSHLISDLLDLGSIESGALRIETSAVDLNSLLSAALEEMQPLAASKGVHITAEPLPQSVQVRCDRRRILQVFSNLVGNAIKFTPANGLALITAALETKYVRVMVSDTGCGIDAAHLPKIFERYYQSPTQQQSGVGLGLFIAKGIVAAHGGRIWAESGLGEGCKFYFTIPTW